jgi:hypothetical protein
MTDQRTEQSDDVHVDNSEEILAALLESQANGGTFEYFGFEAPDGTESFDDVENFLAFFATQPLSPDDEPDTPAEYELAENCVETEIVPYIRDPRPFNEWDDWEQTLHTISLTLSGSLSTRLGKWQYRLARGVRWWGALNTFNINPGYFDPELL